MPNYTALVRQGYDLVIGVGFAQGDAIDTAATQNPNTKFAIVDVDQTGFKHKPKNVVGLLFKEEQVGYLAGVLAGLSVKKSGPPIVGSVGFKEPPVDRFIAGYQAADARYAQPKVKTLNAYSSDWDDQAKCKEIALSQIARGATVVFQVAGGCGLGALSAAKQRKVWGIGVDADQSFLGPFVLTSALKRVGEAVFQTIQTVVDDSWKGGATSPSASTRTESGSARSAQKCRRRTWTLSTRSGRIRSGEITIPTTSSARRRRRRSLKTSCTPASGVSRPSARRASSPSR